MDDCLHNHLSCQTSRQQWYPTRLLSVGDPNQVTQVRLIDTSNLPSGPYMTLSHKWGQAQFLKLETSTFDKLKSGVNIEELPKTFCDAISVAKQFNVPYLWIDSLCIIQNSAEDWNQEAPQMCNVYQNAVCNIAATGAEDSTGGLFFDRNSASVLPCKIELPALENKPDVPRVFYAVEKDYWRIRVDLAPLSLRSWVVQERFLAQRVLHFGKDQILWECAEKYASEQYPVRIPLLVKGWDEYSLKTVSGSIDGAFQPGKIWQMVLRNYTRAQLTKNTDKEIAINGIVECLKGQFAGSLFTVGLWKIRMPYDLLWESTDNDMINRPPNHPSPVYRAPSWSWLSIDGEIEAPELREVRTSENEYRNSGVVIEDIHVVRTDSSPHGNIIFGYIKLKGCLRPAILVEGRYNAPRLLFEEVKIEEIHIHLDNRKRRPTTKMIPVFCLCVETGSFNTSSGKPQLYSRGIILQETATSPGHPSIYRRLGCYVAWTVLAIKLLSKQPRDECQDKASEHNVPDHFEGVSESTDNIPDSYSARYWDSPDAESDAAENANWKSSKRDLIIDFADSNDNSDNPDSISERSYENLRPVGKSEIPGGDIWKSLLEDGYEDVIQQTILII